MGVEMKSRSWKIFASLFGILAPTAFAGEHYYNFNNGSSSGWTTTGGSWTVTGGQYNLAASSSGGKSRISNSNYAGLVYDADVTINSGNYEAGIFFRATQINAGPENFRGYYAYIDQNSDKVGLVRGPGFNVIGIASLPIASGVKYRLSVIAVENRIRVFVDDQLYIDLDDATYASGAVGLTAFVASVSFDNISVTTETQGSMRESYAQGAGRWIPYDDPSVFSVSNKAYRISSSSYGAKSVFANSQFVDNILHCDITLNGPYDAGVLFRVEDPANGIDNYKGYYASVNPTEFALTYGPGFNVLATAPNSGHTAGKTYHFKIETLGALIRVYVDGVKKIEVVSNHYVKGSIGVTSYLSDVVFDNFSIGANVAGGLAKRSASQDGFYGTPNTWSVRTYNHGDYAPELSNMATTFRDKFRDTNFGWMYTSSNGGGSTFNYTDFNWNSSAALRSYDMGFIVTHGNDGIFGDWDLDLIYLRGGYGANSAIFAKQTKFVVLVGCNSLYTGVAAPHDARPYLPVMKGAHAILSYAAKFTWELGSPILNNLVTYFIDNWHANKATGIFPAFREASFKALYYDNGYNYGSAPAVVFTAGDMKGQHDVPRPYWGWEEKTWNIYNGGAYVSAADETTYLTPGEELVYNPGWGYPDKIGHKYAVVGDPDWSGIVPLP